MKENLKFFFNNELSTNMGLANVHLEGGLYTERLIANRELFEETIRGKTKPYFISLEQKPIEFQLSFAFLDSFDDEKLRQVSRWLNVDYYKEFYFIENPTFRYFAMPVSDVNIVHNGLKQGYITLTMRTNDSFAFSEEILTQEYDLSINAETGTKIRIDNNGDLPLAIEMWIRKTSDGDITIINENDDNKEFKIVNLRDGEEVYIDHQHEYIISNVPNIFHFDDILTEYIKLPIGANVLNIYGECKIQFRYRFKYLLGL